MAKQKEVIEPRSHESRNTYVSWLRKIGGNTYRFKIKIVNGWDRQSWEIRVDRSHGWGPNGAGWQTVHQWSSTDEELE